MGLVRRIRDGSIFYGWYIALAGASTNFLVLGAMSFGFGVFIQPIRDELGWSVAAITIGFSIRSFESGLMAPVTGFLVDRVGPRRVAVTGVFIAAGGILLFARAHSLAEYYIASVIISFGQSTGGFTPFSAAVMNWFQRRRAQAMGLLLSGNAAGYLLAPILAVLITTFGWRETLVAVAFVIVIAGVPLALVLRDRPEPYGMHPDGIEPEPSSDGAPSAAAVASTSGMGVAEALRTPAFYLLTIAISFGTPTQSAWLVHQVPHLEDVGFSTVVAGLAVGFYGVLQIPGRFLFGWIADTAGRRRTYIACFVAQSLGLLVFANLDASRPWMLPLFYASYVFGHGAFVVLFMTVTADYFGARRFSTLRGLTMMAQMPLGVALPILAGAWFDRTGSYREIFMIYAGLVLISAVAITLIRRPVWSEVVAAEPWRARSPEAKPPKSSRRQRSYGERLTRATVAASVAGAGGHRVATGTARPRQPDG